MVGITLMPYHSLLKIVEHRPLAQVIRCQMITRLGEEAEGVDRLEEEGEHLPRAAAAEEQILHIAG